jgi:hypothetical protein
MCDQLDDLIRRYQSIAADVDTAGYRIPISIKSSRLRAEIKRHQETCITCQYTAGVVATAIEQGRRQAWRR